MMTEPKAGPLTGIRVVELGTHVAVPNVTRAMADCGAEVIKVEGLKGEEWRILGKNYGIPYSAEENALFTAQNANKKFIALDLKTAPGKEALLKLISQADVFISNVRLKSLMKMGLDYDSLKDRFPKLVYCHFTGFGYQGPDAARPGFDMAAFWARSGAMVDWNNVGDFPMKPVSGFGDATTANLMLSGVLMALLAREKSGKGTLVSTSLYGSALWYNVSGVIQAQSCYQIPYPKSRYAPANPFSHIYGCKDGNWIIITVVDYDKKKEAVFHALGMEAYMDDPRFANMKTLQDNIDEVVKILNERFLEKTRDEWAAAFEENDIVYEKLVHYAEIEEDPQAWENGYLEKVTFPTGTTVAMARFPLLFSEYELKPIHPTSGVGCDTQEILAKAGYSDAEISAMRENGAII